MKPGIRTVHTSWYGKVTLWGIVVVVCPPPLWFIQFSHSGNYEKGYAELVHKVHFTGV